MNLELKKDLWIRCVIIPGINDNENYVNGLYNFLKDIKEKIEDAKLFGQRYRVFMS